MTHVTHESQDTRLKLFKPSWVKVNAGRRVRILKGISTISLQHLTDFVRFAISGPPTISATSRHHETEAVKAPSLVARMLAAHNGP